LERQKAVDTGGVQQMSLLVDTEIPRQRATQLQAQSPVVVKGTIREISLLHQFPRFGMGGPKVVIVLDQLSGE
jgi:hypothetical protein